MEASWFPKSRGQDNGVGSPTAQLLFGMQLDRAIAGSFVAGLAQAYSWCSPAREFNAL